MMKRLFDIPVFHTERWIFNSYAVDDGPRRLVVDAGLPSTARPAIAFVAAPEVEVTIVATHGHSDHVGGIPTLLAVRSCPVMLPVRCRAYLEGEAARTPGPREVAKILPILKDQRFDLRAAREFAGGASIGYGRGTRMELPFAVGGFLQDGDRLGSWDVIHSPGHTDDSTCLYHRDTATLIAGDAILTHAGRAWFNPEITDRRLAQLTEERLRALEVRHLLPGHGRPIEGHHLLRDARSFCDKPQRAGMLGALARALGRW